MKHLPTLASPRVPVRACARAALPLQRRSGVTRNWQCGFCGCARNTASDTQCKLCSRTPGSRRNAARPAFVPVRESPDGSDAVDESSLDAIEVRAQTEKTAAALRRVLNAGVRPECVICYEVTMEGTYCCGQPLCCACASSLMSADCPVCRQKLQHRRAPKTKPTTSTALIEADRAARGGGIDLVALIDNATSVIVSHPPATEMEERADALPQLSHLRNQRSAELPQYVDYVVGYAEGLRSSASTGAYLAESRLRALIEEIHPVIERHLEEIKTSHCGAPRAELRQFERLKRHGLLKPAHLSRLEALYNR